jgi:hypothetical protein
VEAPETPAQRQADTLAEDLWAELTEVAILEEMVMEG